MSKDKSREVNTGETIGARLYKIRKSNRMTQANLSKILGITTNYLGEIERSKRGLSKNVANKICSYFNLTLDYLYNGNCITIDTLNIKEVDSYNSNKELLELLASCNQFEYKLCCTILKDLLEGIREIKV